MHAQIPGKITILTILLTAVSCAFAAAGAAASAVLRIRNSDRF